MNGHRLIATRQLTGDFGTVAPGEEFIAGDIFASCDLVDRDLAQWAQPLRLPEPEAYPPALVLRRATIEAQAALISTTEGRGKACGRRR
jgi:hypothetical protein